MAFSMTDIGRAAKDATHQLSVATTDQKNKALSAAATALREASAAIVEANKADMEAARAASRPEAFLDRLMLDPARVEGMARAVEEIVVLEDPVGRELYQTDRPNGLDIRRVAVPIGVIGMIYESRPNVGADASALALKSGNAIILRGGSESLRSSREIIRAMTVGLTAAGLPEAAIQMLDTTDRGAVGELLRCNDYIDLVIPRGGRGLVELVRDEARVPTLLHLDGNCHTYIHLAADPEKAVSIVANAKLRRTGVCGATESVVMDEAVLSDLLPRLIDGLGDCEVRGDVAAQAADTRVIPANDEDWGTEYLGPILSIKTVIGVADAIAHVQRYSSSHTDAIVTEDEEVARRFMAEIDSAIVMHNASTQFADGGEFGMGAEIGIATGRLHARGPVGLEQLTTYKYTVYGTGQIRP
ncbi:MAG: glutamate-5-semialdehyde dehydrogenase [Parvularcula sp.]